MTAPFAALLVLAGVGTGIYGTLVGLGGGFIVVPLLMFLHPGASPQYITSISLAVVFFNALSATVAYARMKRIDYGIGIPYALATIPGAVLGARLVVLISRDTFSIIFGIFLLAASAVLAWRPRARVKTPGAMRERVVVDRWGMSHLYRTNFWLGIGFSFLAGLVSSLLGLGGGIVHMPVLVSLLQVPVHIAAATSQFVLSITTLSASLTHLASSVYRDAWAQVLFLSVGVAIGAQIGARLSPRLGGGLIVRLLAGALFLVGLRLLVGSLLS